MPQEYRLGPTDAPVDSSWVLRRIDDNVQMSIGDLFCIRDAIIRYLLEDTAVGQEVNRAILVAELTAHGVFGPTGSMGPAGASGPSGPSGPSFQKMIYDA